MTLRKIFLLLLILCSINSHSLDNFAIEKSCPLYEIQKNGEHKKIGKSEEAKEYELRGFKKINNKNYAHIKNENNEFYVNKNCGYQKFEEKPKLEPIFNDEDIKTLDSISDLDKEFLEFCGYLGSHPTKERFLSILSNEKYTEDFNYIYEKLNKSIYSSNIEDKNQFLINLVEILFANQGFNHVVCGSIKNDKLNGPHHHYRFLDLQKNEFIGKNNIKDCGTKDNSGIVKNYDLSFFNTNKIVHTKCHNSYIENLPIRDLIVIMGITGKIKNKNETPTPTNIKNKQKTSSCIYKVDIECKEILFNIIYNNEKKSLITLYPIKDTEMKKRELCTLY